MYKEMEITNTSDTKGHHHYDEVKSYFNDKADVYDDVDEQLYWVLSDMFFKEVLKKEIPKFVNNKKDLKLLDAGAGTGRWTLFFHHLFSYMYKISGTLIDISEKMLKQADDKIRKLDLESVFDCVLGNIEDMSKIDDNQFDISLSFYNVISFVDNPERALKEIAKKLKKDGIHISIVANKYHAYYFSIQTNQIEELSVIKNESKVRFNKLMPYIHCFTPNELVNLYERSGFSNVKIISGPNFFYPGMEETYTNGSTESIHKKLSNNDVFKKILEIELDNYSNGDLIGRGNVLMAIAVK